MSKVKKGDYGYIKAYKTGKLLWSLAFAIMISITVIATIIMFGDTSRVAIVFAILLSLPFAKFLISYIMSAPFNPLSEDDYRKICDGTCDSNGVCQGLYFDIAISMYEGINFYPSMCIKNGRIYAYVIDKQFNTNKKNYEKWIKQCIADSKYDYPITLFDNLDAYIKKVGSISSPNDKTLLIDKFIKDKIFESSL